MIIFNMKKIIITILMFSPLKLFSFYKEVPDTDISSLVETTELPSSDIISLYRAIETIINIFYGFIVAGSVIGVIVGAYLILFSGGDSGKAGNGRKAIIYSLVALLIASFAWAIVLWAESGFVF